MSTSNSQKHFAVGVGLYVPWRTVDRHVKAAMTKQSPKRKYQYATGIQWRNGKLVPSAPIPDRQRVLIPGGRRLVTIAVAREVFPKRKLFR